MPTIPELITATEAAIAQNTQTRETLQAAIEARVAQLAQAETRRALLKTRLETLQTLLAEG